MKRLICFLITLIMLMQTASFAAAAEEVRVHKSIEVEFFERLGVLTNLSELSYGNSVTRGDFAVYLSRFLKIDEYEYAEERYFKDLPMESYVTQPVNALTVQGVFSIGDDRYFRPDDAILGVEAVKALLYLMDYEEIIAAKGGYPVGCVSLANSLKILRGIDDPYSPITLNQLAMLMYNAVTTDMCNVGVVKNYAPDNLLYLYHKMRVSEGIVESANMVSVKSDASTEVGEAVVSGVKYDCSETENINSYIGRNIDFIYKENKDEERSLFFIENQEDDILEISIEDVNGYDGDYINYDKDNKTTREKVIGLTVIYNGEELTDNINTTLNSLNKGKLTFIDSDLKDGYDVLYVRDYYDFVIKSRTDDNVLYNDIAGNDTLNMENFEYCTITTAEGEKQTEADLIVGKVLQVAKSKSHKIGEIITCDKTVSGKITAISDNDNIYITIDSSKYKVDKMCYEREKSNLTIASSIDAKLNALGEIVWVRYLAGDYNVAYLVASKLTEGLTNDLTLKLFTLNGEHLYLRCADRIRVDEISYTETTYKEMLKNIPNKDGVTDTQVILYNTNEKGEVKEIDTYLSGGTLTRVTNGIESLIKWPTRFGNKLLYSSVTKVFKVPQDDEAVSSDEVEFMVTNVSGFPSTVMFPIEAYVYDKDNEFADILVSRTNYGLTSENEWLNSNMILVSEVSEAINENGDVVKALKGLVNGSDVVYNFHTELLAESDSLDDISEGDLVRCRVNNKGIAIAVDILYDASEGKRIDWKVENNSSIAFSSATNDSFQLSFGYVHKKGKSSISWNPTDGTTATEAYDISYIPVMVYDKNRRNEKVYKGTINDIADYDSVYTACDIIIIQYNQMAGKGLVVYKQ